MPRSFDMATDYETSVEQLLKAFHDQQYWLDRLAGSGSDEARLEALKTGPDGSVEVATVQILRADRLPAVGSSAHAPALPGMSEEELAAADVWATGISPDSYPTQFVRADLEALGVVPAGRLLSVPDGSRVLVAGAVTHRQRPATARGVTFLNLEDETGMVNVLCTPGMWTRHRRIALGSAALLIRGRVQNASGAVTVLAERMRPLAMAVGSRSRDFR